MKLVMKLSFKYHCRLNTLQQNIIEELSYHTTKLYNIANYKCITDGYSSYYDMERNLKSNWHNEYLHSHTYQQFLKVLDQDWKSYLNAFKDYKKYPQKYLGKPRQPGYKNDRNKNQIIFTNYAIRMKSGMLMLSLSKAMQSKFNVKSLNLQLPKKVEEHVNMEQLQQVKVTWDNVSKQWYFILIYKQEEVKVPDTYQNIMAIDLGLDNLCAITFKDSKEQFLISGKTIKSKNSYYNKEIARLTSIRMKETGSTHFKRTKNISKLQRRRNNVINNTIHKVSRQVIQLAKEYSCHTIVIGDIGGIKQLSTIKSFVQIPIKKLVQQIKYKANLVGIQVEIIQETYTSGVSAYDMEPINRYHYNKKRRIKRGLFKTNDGHYVNSDINGSLNILRKYLKDNVVPMPVKRLRNNGCLDHPVRLLTA